MKQDVIESVIVSPEMTTLIGTGDIDGTEIPDDSALLVFGFNGMPTVRLAADAARESLGAPEEGAGSISFVVQHAALERLFGWSVADMDRESFHLTSDLRAIALKIRDCPMAGPAATTYRKGKSIELLCETVTLLASGQAVPVEGALNFADSARLVAARRIIDERWAEKLTLDGLARACGINRAKLTRGFRELYRCTVAEAISDRRLAEASRALLTTDLPVSSIGYASGYLNNASFSRAFGRRFGVSPSEYRVCRVAA
jgi:AraC family transcriptional activator of pyochelin receptor